MLNSGYCRLCAEIKLYSNLSVIKHEDEFSKNLCYQISQCFQVQITSDDNLPKTVCLECCTQTNMFYEFIQKVHKAQEFLRDVVYNPLVNNFQLGFIHDDLIKTKAEHDGPHSETEHIPPDVHDLWEESSKDSTIQSSSKTKIRNKVGSKKIKIESDVKVKEEITEVSDAQTNKLGLRQKNKNNRKRKRSKNKLGECQKRICKVLKDYTFICNICSDDLKTRYELIDHFQQKHEKTAEYTCLDCSKSYTNYPIFVKHVARHQNANKFCCEECGKTYNDKRTVQRHIKYVHGHEKFTCELCDKSFKSMKGLEKHKLLHMPNQPAVVKKYACTICHKKLLTEDELIEHQKVHDESNKHFTCEKCGSRFRAIRNLEEHMENVHAEYTEDKYLQCPLCPAKLKHLKQLVRHKREIHSGRKRFECETCGKEYYLLSKFKLHLTLHTGERPHKCPHCEKSFRLKPQLENHKRQHTGEKPYCCFECTHYFTDFANYIKHMKRKHGVTSFKKVKKITDVQPVEEKPLII